MISKKITYYRVKTKDHVYLVHTWMENLFAGDWWKMVVGNSGIEPFWCVWVPKCILGLCCSSHGLPSLPKQVTSMFLTQDYKFHLILVRKRKSKQLLVISNAEPEIFIQVLKNSRTFILKCEHPTQNQAQWGEKWKKIITQALICRWRYDDCHSASKANFCQSYGGD